MSLRRAMSQLADDRDTHVAVREVMWFFESHAGEQVEASRVARATGMTRLRVEPVLEALSEALVIDFDGDPDCGHYTYSPDSILGLEVQRFLRSGSASERGLQRGVDRYRSRHPH